MSLSLCPVKDTDELFPGEFPGVRWHIAKNQAGLVGRACCAFLSYDSRSLAAYAVDDGKWTGVFRNMRADVVSAIGKSPIRRNSGSQSEKQMPQ